MFELSGKTLQQLVYAGDGTALSPMYVEAPSAPRFHGCARTAKRLMDLIGATLLLVSFAVPFLIISIAVRWGSPGPALFRTRRIGLNGRPFVMWKFRTMYSREQSDGAL